MRAFYAGEPSWVRKRLIELGFKDVADRLNETTLRCRYEMPLAKKQEAARRAAEKRKAKRQVN